MDFIAKSATDKVPSYFHGCIRQFSINSITYNLKIEGKNTDIHE